MLIYIELYIYYIYIYIYIHRPPMAHILFLCSKNVFSKNNGDAKPVFLFVFVLLRPWDISHRVERQKLMVKSWEEMSVRVRKGGFMANLLLH